MSKMFNYCKGVTSLDLSSFDTSNVTFNIYILGLNVITNTNVNISLNNPIYYNMVSLEQFKICLDIILNFFLGALNVGIFS